MAEGHFVWMFAWLDAPRLILFAFLRGLMPQGSFCIHSTMSEVAGSLGQGAGRQLGWEEEAGGRKPMREKTPEPPTMSLWAGGNMYTYRAAQAMVLHLSPSPHQLKPTILAYVSRCMCSTIKVRPCCLQTIHIICNLTINHRRSRMLKNNVRG